MRLNPKQDLYSWAPFVQDYEEDNGNVDGDVNNADDEFGADAVNPVEEAKERLLDLEANIERRYLKAPLGVSNTDISLQTITSSITK